MKWENLTSPAIANLDKTTPVVLNMASIEQHGPHLPLSTDTDIGEHFLQRLNTELNDQILTLPTVKIGCSAHHMDFAGSLTVSHESMLTYCLDILNSVIHHGFSKILILNSHGGNNAIGKVLAEKLAAQPDINIDVLFTSWWRVATDRLLPITESGPLGTGHACEFETSLMQFIAPEKVDFSTISQQQHYIETSQQLDSGLFGGSKADYIRTMKDISGGTGVVGDPATASPEKGEQISHAVHQSLLALIETLRAL